MNQDSETMEDAIEAVVTRVLYNEVSTFFPACIDAVKESPSNSNTIVVDVTSGFLMVNPEDNTTKPRKIQNVPIILPERTNTFLVRPPLDEDSLVGAYVGLLVSNNYLANWKKNGGQVLPTDGRKFYYADAVALLGFYPDLKAWSTPPKDNTGQIKVKKGTYLEIGNSQTDLFRLISDLLNILKSATTLVAGSPVPLTFIPSTLQPLKTIDQLITDLATITQPDYNP